MGTTTANAAEFQDGGKPVAQPIYQVDSNGSPLVNASQDGAPNTGIQEVSVGLYNSSNNTFDRLRDAGSLGDNYTIGLIGAVQFLFNGGSYDRERTPTKFVTIPATAITAGTPVAIWTPGSGKKFHLMGYCIAASVQCSIIFKDGGTEIWRVPVLANSPIDSPANFGNGYASNTANNALNFDVTASGVVSGFCFGTEEF